VAALQMAVRGPVILLTSSYLGPVMPSIPAAALAVVQKPFRESELLATVAEALDVGRLLVNLTRSGFTQPKCSFETVIEGAKECQM
jgi:hypothetical protein